MTWAFKRQIFFILVLILFITLSGFIILFPSLNKTPTCTDRKQNGEETGVDCGGKCARACTGELSTMSIRWARAFEVVPGRYNAVAYVVNHNKSAAIKKIHYRFRFADKDNIIVGKREGTTFVPPGGNFAVFEPAINIGNSFPVYTTFEFIQAPEWYQVPKERLDQLKILVSNLELEGVDSAPRLSGEIKNTSLFKIPNVGVIAILYDKEGNALAASRTYIDELAPLGIAPIDFTWQLPFKGEVIEREIIPMFDVFSASLK